jgi:homoserine O-acetyltransferase
MTEEDPIPIPLPAFEGDFVIHEVLSLESGEILVNPTLHYAVYGQLNADRSNAVLVCHALSGSARVGDWWPQLFLPGDLGLLDLTRDCVIGINIFGSCYGSTGPGSIDPATGKP